jgi:hypothetical protein
MGDTHRIQAVREALAGDVVVPANADYDACRRVSTRCTIGGPP